MSKYKLEKCNDSDLWDGFVEKSPQGSIFCKTNFIQSLGIGYTNFFIKKGEEIFAGYTIYEESENNIYKEPIPFVQYRGIMFKDFSNELKHKMIQKVFALTGFIINEVIDMYGSFSMIHPPAFTDMRPFLWYNYQTPEKGQFKIAIKYTPILTIKDNIIKNYLTKIRTVRRQEYRKTIKYKIVNSEDIDILNKLHEKTFAKANIARTDQEIRLLKRITKASLDNNYGRLSFLLIDDIPVSGILFIYDNKRGYYLFGANDPKYLKTGASTKLMIDNILYTRNQKGLNQIDFVGANSPNRGDYKLSFNADLVVYYETQFNI